MDVLSAQINVISVTSVTVLAVYRPFALVINSSPEF